MVKRGHHNKDRLPSSSRPLWGFITNLLELGGLLSFHEAQKGPRVESKFMQGWILEFCRVLRGGKGDGLLNYTKKHRGAVRGLARIFLIL